MMDRDTGLTAGSCLWHRPRATLLVLVASVSLAAVASAHAVEAQEASQEGGVVAWTAQVRDATSNEALLGAVIELGGMVRRYVTDVDGRAVMDVPRGRYKVTVRRWGYDKLTGDLFLARRGKRTHVLTRDMLDQLAVTRLTDAFRALPNIRVDRLVSGATRLVNRSRFSLRLYVYGVERYLDGNIQRRLDIDDLPPESVELIEVWENPSCGTVLIWTR